MTGGKARRLVIFAVRRHKVITFMNRKEKIERILGTDFLQRFNDFTGRKLTIRNFGDKPDLVCVDNNTKKTVGIEITQLLKPEFGKDRAFSESTFQCVNNILKKHCSGGIVSVGFGTKLPENKIGLVELETALSEAICDAGGLKAFSSLVNRKGWGFNKIKISEIFIDENRSEWKPLTDAPLSYQSQVVDSKELIERVSKKAMLSESYENTDELILLIRNPHKKWEPSNIIMKEIAAVKGKHIDSVWITNWKMDTLPCLPNIIRIDV